MTADGCGVSCGGDDNVLQPRQRWWLQNTGNALNATEDSSTPEMSSFADNSQIRELNGTLIFLQLFQ